MTTHDVIKDLDAALTEAKAGGSTDFAEEYPDAPQQSIETAKKIEENKAKIEEFTERLEEKQQQQREQQKAVLNALEETVEEVRTRTATLASQYGIATEEEKQLLKKAPREQDATADGLAAFFLSEDEPE